MREADRGQITTLMVIPVAVGLVWLMMTVMIGLGDGTRSRTQTQVAADSAALAAATAYKTALLDQLTGLPTSPVAAVAALQRLLTTSPVDLAGAVPEVQAREFAQVNSATIGSFSLVPSVQGLEFHVVTRSRAAAVQTGVFTRAEATARLEPTSGLCWSGTGIGLDLNGTCTTSLKGMTSLPDLSTINLQAVLVQ